MHTESNHHNNITPKHMEISMVITDMREISTDEYIDHIKFTFKFNEIFVNCPNTLKNKESIMITFDTTHCLQILSRSICHFDDVCKCLFLTQIM